MFLEGYKGSVRPRERALVAAAFFSCVWIALGFWSPSPSAAENYVVDALGRLTDVTYDNGGSIHYTYDPNGNILAIVTTLDPTAVEGESAPALEFALAQNTPNPGSTPMSISFSTPARGPVALRVFDVGGRQIAALVDGVLDPGRHIATSDARRWAAGVYFYRLEAGGRTLARRLVVLR